METTIHKNNKLKRLNKFLSVFLCVKTIINVNKKVIKKIKKGIDKKIKMWYYIYAKELLWLKNKKN